MDPVLAAELASPAPTIFGAIEIAFPGYTLRLLDGSAEVEIGGEMFVGKDPTFGTLASIGELTEEIGNQAPEVTIGLYPPDATAAATLAHASMQGSIVRLMIGAVDPATGQCIGEPDVLFLGEIDVPTIEADEGGQDQVSYTVVSVFERLFEIDEGQRATDSYHQSIYPGELGLEFMTGTDTNLYWGAKPPSGSQTARLPFSGRTIPI